MDDNDKFKRTERASNGKCSPILIKASRSHETSSDSSDSIRKIKANKKKRSRSTSKSKSSSISSPIAVGTKHTSRSSSHQSSVGYGSGEKPSSRAWSRNSDEFKERIEPDAIRYTSSSNFADDKYLATRYHTSITAALDSLKDDIMYGKQADGDGPHRLKTISEVVSASGGEGNIGNQQLVYVEGRKGGFVPKSRSVALSDPSRKIWFDQVSDLDLQTPLDLAISVQNIFAPLSTISFGLLGGVALMQSFMSYTYLNNRNSVDDMFSFIESYNIFAKVAPTAFYILLAICIVAIFDRFDLAHLDVQHCSDTLVYRHGWILLLLYMVTLILTLCTAELDDMLLLYPHDKDFTMNQQEMFLRLSQWHTLNVFRCALAILGWVIMAIAQPDDLLLHHLKAIKQFDVQTKDIIVVGSPSTIRENDY